MDFDALGDYHVKDKVHESSNVVNILLGSYESLH
jgi:hypothetical protein